MISENEIIQAVKRIRDTAMEQTLAARIPECGEFGAIAQDADWLFDTLTAADCVREEDNAGEPVAWGEDIDGKIVSVRLDKSRHCTVPLYRTPHSSREPISLDDAEKAFLDRVWPRLQNGCYRAHNLIPIEIQRMDFNEFVRDGLCAVFEAADRMRADEPVIHARFETVDETIPVTGSTAAPIKRVEQNDDGSYTVIIDHWPQPSGSGMLVERQTLEDVRLLVARINSLHPIESEEVHQVYDEICRALNSLTAGKSEQEVSNERPETVESVLLDAVRKIASEDLTNCANMTTAEIFGALSRMHETAAQALRRVKESVNGE